MSRRCSQLNATTEASTPSASLAPKATAGARCVEQVRGRARAGSGGGRTQPAQTARALARARGLRLSRVADRGVHLAARGARDEPDADRENGRRARFRHPRRHAMSDRALNDRGRRPCEVWRARAHTPAARSRRSRAATRAAPPRRRARRAATRCTAPTPIETPSMTPAENPMCRGSAFWAVSASG